MRKLRTVPLGTVVERIRSGVSPVCEERPPADGEFGVLTLAAITAGIYDSSKAKALAAEAVQDRWPRVRAGRILITRASGSKDLVGACVLPALDEEQRLIPDTAWQIELRGDTDVPARWVLEFLRSSNGRRAIEQIARGSSGIWKITKGTFDSIKLPVGPPERMDRASGASMFYEKVGRTIEAVMAGKRELKRGLMQQLLTGRRRFPDFGPTTLWVGTSIGQLPAGWQAVSLGEHAKELSTRNHRGMGEDRVMGVIKGVGLEPMRDHVRAADLSRYKVLPPDAFAYNPMRLNIGSIARNRFADPCLVSPDYVVFRTNGALLPAFLDHLRHSHLWQQFVYAAGAGSVRVRIYFRDLSRVVIPLPPLEEQRRIAEVLTAIDREVELLAAQREQYELQKRGVMQKLLSGDIEIPADEPEDRYARTG